MEEKAILETVEKARDYFIKYDSESEMIKEANVRENVVVELLNVIGYSRENMVRESQATERRRQAMDIKIINLGIDNEELVVEVKRGDIELNYLHLEQTLSYLDKKTRFEWAILTNGIEYQLINRRIVVEDYNIEQKVVESFSIYDENEQLIEKIKLFSYDSLYGTGTTNYFKYIQQYYALRYNEVDIKYFKSWKSGIVSLVKYLINRYNGQYIDLDKLGKRDIEGFFNYLFDNKSINSMATLRGVYSFLDIFFETMLKSKGLQLHFNPLRHIPRQQLFNKCICQPIFPPHITRKLPHLTETFLPIPKLVGKVKIKEQSSGLDSHPTYGEYKLPTGRLREHVESLTPPPEKQFYHTRGPRL